MAESCDGGKDACNLVVGVFSLAYRAARFVLPANIAACWISRLVAAVDIDTHIASAANFCQLVSRHSHLTASFEFDGDCSNRLGWAFVGAGTNL